MNPILPSNSVDTGFTLIELVIVVVLIAVLAAFALPKFSDLSDEAQLSQTQGLASAFNVAVKTVQLVFRTQGNTTRVQNLANFGDGTVDTNNIGFPVGTNKGNANENIGQGNIGCDMLWIGLLDTPPTVAFNNNNQAFRSYRHTSNRVCSYVYRGNGDTGNQNTGQLTLRYDSRDGTVDICGTRSDIPAC